MHVWYGKDNMTVIKLNRGADHIVAEIVHAVSPVHVTHGGSQVYPRLIVGFRVL